MEEKELYDAVLLEVFSARLDIMIAMSYAETAVKHRRKLFDPPIKPCESSDRNGALMEMSAAVARIEARAPKSLDEAIQMMRVAIFNALEKGSLLTEEQERADALSKEQAPADKLDPDPTSALVTAREIITRLTMALKPLADVADAADQGTIDSGDDGVLFDVKIAKLTINDCRKARDLLARVVPR